MRLTKAQRAYRKQLEAIRAFVDVSAFPAPSKATAWHRRKLRKYATTIAELRGQPVYFYRARNPGRKKILQKEYGGSGLPALKGAFLPVQDYGDRATPKFNRDGSVKKIVTRNESQTVEREFVPIPLPFMAARERSAALKREFRNAVTRGADNVRVAQGSYDSSFVVFPAESSPERRLIRYVAMLIEKYSEIDRDGNPGPNDVSRWLHGLISFKVLRGSEFVPPRRGGKKRAK